MPFENLTERIQMSLRRLTGRGKLTEKDMYAALGWLLREGKINVVEEGKELLINLI